LADVVLKVLKKFKALPGRRILDFGAGSWLRYSQRIRSLMPDRELYAVEYAEAFHDDASALKDQFRNDLELWRPVDFVKHKDRRFDLVLVVNVLNTIPEEAHRRSVFSTLADRLNPNGWLLVYQRIWAESENPAGAIEYGDGWLIPQPYHSYYTYRARTGARWFNQEATALGLRALPTPETSSSNVILRLWEKPF
jgi:hypothetical protein